MKKALLVLLALVLGAGLLFAADAKWGAWIEGDVVLYDDGGNAYMGPSWLTGGPYNTLSLSYSEDNFGFAMTDEFDADGWGVALRDIKGWYKLFDGMVKVSAGKLRIGDYRPTDFVEATSIVTRILNAQWGALVQLSPVKGLSVGVAAQYPVGAAAQDYANNLAFAASYDIANIAKLTAQYRTINDELGVSVEVNAIKGLPILLAWAYDLDGSAASATSLAKASWNRVLVSTSYTMDKLSAAVTGVGHFASDATLFAVEANVGYALSDTYKVGANLGYDTGYGFFTDGDGGFFVYPWVNVTVGGGSLNLGFALSTGGTNNPWDIPDAGVSGLTWKIHLKYVIAF